MKALILLNILFCVNIYGAQQRVDPLVLINQGLVRGQKAIDGDYSTFLGIPYAKVDFDDPFGLARPAPSFGDEIFYAYEASTQCPQTPFTGYARAATKAATESVDCLQLNVFVPSQASVQNPLPVLVWIHGGVYLLGTAHEFGARNLVKHGVIVVTVNYRLGPYGFMCLNDPAVPANQGLKDQYAALQWVRDNIASFGGNPYNVTIAGQSAGSASVLLHLYSPKTKLFNKVIAESGTPLSPDMFTNGDPDAAVKLANYLGLNSTDNQLALEFLAKTHHSLVTGAAHDLAIEFKPCKESSDSVDIFVDSESYSLSNERKIRNTPILIGNTDLEYRGDVQLMHGQDFFDRDFFYSRLQHTFNLDEDELERAAAIVRHFYIGDKSISADSVLTEAEYFSSDFVFNHPIQDTITSILNENASPVYEYVFSYVGDTGLSGAAHSAELPFLFDIFDDMFGKLTTDDDFLVSDRLTTLWTNFIKYGNPTPETSELIPITWTPITRNTRQYLLIDRELRMVEDRFLKERMAFWDLFYSIYGQYNIFARRSDK